MRILPPTYTEDSKTFQADTCTPLERAARAGRIRLNALARGHYPGARLSRAALPNLKSVGYWDAITRQDWGLDWHRNEGIELTFLETGSLPFAVDGRSWPLTAGDISITRPWQSHRVGDPDIGVGRLHWVILDVEVRRPNQPWRWPSWLILAPKDLSRLTELLRHNEQPVWRATPDIKACFQKLGRVLDGADTAGVESRLAVFINELFLAVMETLSERRIPLNPGLTSARRSVELFLNEFPDDSGGLSAPWTVYDMAEHCGVGVTAFTRHCREITNMTPLQFVNARRLSAAARILVENPVASITDIALDCGFHSSQYFATAFRQRFGCTPRAYRDRGKNGQTNE